MMKALLLLNLFFLLNSIAVAETKPPAPPHNLRLVSATINHPPVSADDVYSTMQDGELVVTAPGILANDSDPDGDALTAILVSGPTSGKLELSPDGSFSYLPEKRFAGQDSFSYRASDREAQSGLATVNIFISSLQEGLVAHWTLDESSGTVALDSTSYRNDLVLLPANSEPVWGPGHKGGALVFNGTSHYADATNVPVNQTVGGKNTIVFWMKWGGIQTYMSVLTSLGGPQLQIVGGRFGISTAKDWPSLDTLGISWPTATYSNKWVHVVAVFYNPDTTQEGWESLWASESKLYIDGVEQEIAQVGTLQSNRTTMQSTIRLARDSASRYYDGRIDDVRVYSRELTAQEVSRLYNPWAFDDSYLRDASLPLSVEAPGVLANDASVEGTVLTPVLVDEPAHGSIVLSPDGSFIYTPNAGYHWGDSFTYKVNDGLFDSGVATVTILTDAPVASNIDSYNTHRNTPVTYGAAGGVLHYATARKGSPTATAYPLTINPDAKAEVISGPANGTLAFKSDGSFTYTPDADFTGRDSLTYRTYDGRTYYSQVATATITVSENPKEIPELVTWESRMIQYGKIHGDRFLDGSSDAWQTYYDAQRIFEDIADYTSDDSWLRYSEAAGGAYMLYVEKSPSYHGGYGAIQGYWNFTHGLTRYHLRTGDVRSREAVIMLSRNAACTNEMTDYTEDALRSRETAYALTSHINAERVGHERFDAKTDALYDHALGHLDQWFIDNNYEVDPQLVFKPFMFGLTAEALIFYWDYVNEDPRILKKLQRGADALFSWMIDEDGVIAWDSERGSFWYVTTGSERTGLTGPATVAPDLNLLIAPLYSWLYLQTGDATYRDRGDIIFASGATQAYFSYFKAFNQSYRWSFDYLKWRSEANRKLAATTAKVEEM